MEFNQMCGPFVFVPYFDEKQEKEERESVDSSIQIFKPDENLTKGNILKKEYIPFDSYEIQKPIITSEKARMLWTIIMYSNAAHDLKLYLDIHPKDEKVFDKYKEYCEECRKLTDEYESLYEPIYQCGGKNKNGEMNFNKSSSIWVK